MTDNYRKLSAGEIAQLQAQGCTAQNWDTIHVAEAFSADYVRNVEFYGTVQLGSNREEIEVTHDFRKHCGIRNAVLKDVCIGDNCLIENVRNYINNYQIGERCLISNVCAIETTPGHPTARERLFRYSTKSARGTS